jgi:DNA polymerase-3 subunit alpha
MDAVSFYSHEHELANVNTKAYEITDFNDIPENPVVERIIPIKGRQIPIFKLYRIAGTILDKDKNKKKGTRKGGFFRGIDKWMTSIGNSFVGKDDESEF